MKNLVYLAGPITGLTFGEATDWRDEVRRKLPRHIKTLSPMRGKQYLEQRSSFDGKIMDSYAEYPLSSARGINTRDHWDCTRATAVFVNLLGAKTVSIGTVMEIAWAYTNGVPCIMVIEDTGNIHEHSMIRESVGFRVNSLDMGIEVLISLLSTDEEIEQMASWQRDQALNEALAEQMLANAPGFALSNSLDIPQQIKDLAIRQGINFIEKQAQKDSLKLAPGDGPLPQIEMNFETPIGDSHMYMGGVDPYANPARNPDGSPYKTGESGQGRREHDHGTII
jgi:hypothetical protein